MDFMDFTKGEIVEIRLRLIGFAIDSGPLIAGCYAASASFYICDKQTRLPRGGDEPEQLFQNFTLGEIQRYFPVFGCSLFNTL